MGLRFDHPELLLLMLLAVPVVIIGLRALRAVDRLRRWTVIALRVGVIALMSIILAGPHLRREHNQLTVIGLLDVSGSVRRFADLPEMPELQVQTNLEYLRHWFREATQTRAPDDRFGLVIFDGRAAAISTPTRGDYPDDHLDLTILEGTNIAEAIQLGLAMFPADTSKRLVLVSDGNETVGSALAAAREAAGRMGADLESILIDASVGVPIDVVPIAYRVEQDSQVVRIEVPQNARPGQVIRVRIVLEAIRPINGYLGLVREGAPVDLNGDEPGFRRALRLPAGRTVYVARAELGQTPVNRFRAFFEPANPADDLMPENNRADAFVATPSKGSVLIVRDDVDAPNDPLESALRGAGIPVSAVSPPGLPTNLLQMQSYDLIVLDNVAAYEVDPAVQELLARYVNDFGGGLIMTGGEKSFGAGGWNGTALEDVLPVELDLPREMRLTQAALILVMDKSGSMSMPVAGSRATQQEIANRGAAAAIESLQTDSLVGVVVFDTFTHVRVPLGPNDDPIASVRKVMGITPGGGTYMVPALKRAHQMLNAVDVGKKYVVCLSDGRSDGRQEIESIVAAMAADGIKVSAIAVGDAADHALLQRIAEVGGGTFYPVINPATLPRVLVDSVQMVNKPLIKEVTFTPVVRPTGSSLTVGMEEAPALEGLVLTAHRDDPMVTTEMITPDGEPLLAHWQAGLGRAAAFTSDTHGPWSQRWLGWSGYGTFWTQLVRTISRPPMSQEYELTTAIIDGRLEITLDASEREAGFLDFLVVRGTVYTPDGDAIDVRLHQVGPGRYTTRIDAPQSGNYIVALTPRRGDRALTPVIGGVNQPEGAEFRRYRSNIALLQKISDETGGRLLDINAPAAIDLYDRTGMPPSVSILPAWRMLLWWLLALLLLDVAARRIAWDRATIERAFAAAWKRVTPAHVKARRTAATLATLKERSEEVDQAIAREGAAFDKLEGDSRVKLPPLHRPERVSAQERRRQIRAALAKLSGRSASKEQPPDQPAPSAAAEPESPPDKESTPSGTTSDLLEARRRLRKKLAGEDDHSA